MNKYIRRKDFQGFFEFWNKNLGVFALNFTLVPFASAMFDPVSLEFTAFLLFIMVMGSNWHFRKVKTLRNLGVLLIFGLLVSQSIVLGLGLTVGEIESVYKVIMGMPKFSKITSQYLEESLRLAELFRGHLEYVLEGPLISQRINGTRYYTEIDFRMNQSYYLIFERYLDAKSSFKEFRERVTSMYDMLDELRSRRGRLVDPLFDAYFYMIRMADASLQAIDLAQSTISLEYEMLINGKSELSSQVIEQ